MDTSDKSLKRTKMDEYEYDEEIVVLKISDLVKDGVLQTEGIDVKMTGFETNNPVLQIGGGFYECELRETLGSSAIFLETDKEGAVDEVFDVSMSTTLEFQRIVNKELVAKRVFVKPKSDEKK